jgi:hypothetical protein
MQKSRMTFSTSKSIINSKFDTSLSCSGSCRSTSNAGVNNDAGNIIWVITAPGVRPVPEFV